MYVLNFAHPITGEQAEQLKKLLGTEIEIVDIPVQLDLSQPMAEQIESIVDSIGWTPTDWQTNQFIVNPPGLSTAASVLLASIHGRAGYFPSIIVLRREDGTPPRFVVSEVADLQAVRDSARIFKRYVIPLV